VILITVNGIDGIDTVFIETGEIGSIQHQLITPPTPVCEKAALDAAPTGAE
jgi:hypothetical protein